jgi:hypothetical protein
MTEIKTTKIPRRQKCINKEEPYIGGAVDIIDDNSGLTQAEINAIVMSGNVNLSLSARTSSNLTSAFAGTAINITLVATCSTTANTIEIKKGTSRIGEAGTNTRSITRTHNLTPTEGNNTYTANALVGSIPKNASANIIGVLPVSYGALDTYSALNLTQVTSPVTKVAGQYNMTLDGTRRYIYFKVPKRNVTGISSVGMGSGAEISPVLGGYVSELEDNDYRVWKSDDGFTGSGTQVFTVS